MALCFQFIMTAVSVALPIPAGVFFPVFLIGKEKFEITNKIIIIISRSVDCVWFWCDGSYFFSFSLFKVCAVSLLNERYHRNLVLSKTPKD